MTATTGTPGDVAEAGDLQPPGLGRGRRPGRRDRAALDLHLRQGLEGAGLGEALGMSPDNANVLMSGSATRWSDPWAPIWSRSAAAASATASRHCSRLGRRVHAALAQADRPPRGQCDTCGEPPGARW